MTKPDAVEYETTSKEDAVCPHCGREQMDSNELGGWSNDTGEAPCDDCGVKFKWVRETTITYTTSKP